MDKESRNNAIAAACILLGFGLLFFFMPKIMLAVGQYSTIVAGLIAVACVAAFFLLFWWRGKQNQDK